MSPSGYAAGDAAERGSFAADRRARSASVMAGTAEQAGSIPPRDAVTAPIGTAPNAAASQRLGRHGLLTRVLGATAAVGALTLARDVAPAHADARGSILAGVGTTLNFGLAATDGPGDDPLSYLPNLSGFAYGVVGTRGAPSFPPPRSAGVLGSGFDSGGVVGISQVDVGVYGQLATGVGAVGVSTSGAGVYGFSTNSTGVFGTSPANVGVYGQGTRNAGVFGTSPVYGVWGRTGTGFGVNGEATGSGIGVYGRAGAGGWAGYFDGNVFVSGRVVQGGGAALQAATAETREDVGRARLIDGRASVPLDADVAGTLGDDYHVFLTGEGDSNGLYVTERSPTAFGVRERGGGTSSASFSYRVVAARRAGPKPRPAPMPRSERGQHSDLAEQEIRNRPDVLAPTPPELPKDQPVGPPKRERR